MKQKFITMAAAALAVALHAGAQTPQTTVTLANGAELTILIGFQPENGVSVEDASNTAGKDIVIPSTVTYGTHEYTVTSVGAYAFYGQGLYSVTVPNTVENISFGAFQGCTQLVEATVGTGLTDLAETAFDGCTSLSTLNWNADSCELEEFDGSGPFGWPNMGLTTLNLGPDVRYIGSGVFEYLDDLTTINIAAERVIMATGNSFWDAPSGIAIQVPCSQLGAYQAHGFWSTLGAVAADCGGATSHTLTVAANDASMGTAWGGCTFAGDTTTTIYALPAAGHGFSGWSDGVGDNPRSIVVNSDSTVTALFFTAGSTVCDSTVYDTVTYYADTVVVTAYDTVRVYDTVVVTSYDTVMIYDTVIVTVYDTVVVSVADVEAIPVKVFVAGGRLVIEGAQAGEVVRVYDVQGRQMFDFPVQGERTEAMLPPTGAYLVRIGNRAARKVLIRN